MKVIKSNSKFNYDFSEQSNFCGMNSLKKRIIGDFSTDESCVDDYYKAMSGAMTKDEIRSSGTCNHSQKVDNSELEIKGSDLRNKRWKFRHSPTDPQFNAKATLSSCTK